MSMSQTLNPIELAVFVSRLDAVCEEMETILQRAAFSPNIKDRLDFSCAIFDSEGRLSAQAAHIPVHLGSMAFAMSSIIGAVVWEAGDMLVVNDPFRGGTHLPDVTVVAPVFVEGSLVAFVANRAHHANIGAAVPGSMPISASIDEEGELIPPTLLVRQGELQEQVLAPFEESERGDFVAQVSANRAGVTRLQALIESLDVERYKAALIQVNDYGEQLARERLGQIPEGRYCFEDMMDDDGLGHQQLKICVAIDVSAEGIEWISPEPASRL